MSVTQYIGSRYVPVFADPTQWDNTRVYEPLTIVLYGGDSYTSKQFVPAGIAITNTNYWAVTGNYNAQIEQYRNETRAANETASNAVTIANGAVSTANTANTTANTAVTTAESATATAQQAYSNADVALQNANAAGVQAAYATDTANNAQTAANNATADIDALEGKLNSIFKTPEEYGAVGDGITDDTLAFQAMLDDLQNYGVILLSNKTYRLTAGLILTKRYVQMTSLYRSEYTPCLKFEGNNYANCLTVTAPGFGMENIELDGDLYSGNSAEKKLLILDATNENGNIDAQIEGCTFIHMSHGIVIKGRNVNMLNNLFSQQVYTSSDRAAIVLSDMETPTARRGIIIDNCRFHGCSVCVRNTITTYSEIHTMSINNNYFDFCGIMYMGICDGLQINNNRFIQTTVSQNVLNLEGTIQTDTACSISNNIISSTASNNPFRTAIHIGGVTAARFVINGNNFVTSFTGGKVVDLSNSSTATDNLYLVFTGNYIESNTNEYGISIAANNANKAFKGLVSNNVFYVPNGAATNTLPATITAANNVSL